MSAQCQFCDKRHGCSFCGAPPFRWCGVCEQYLCDDCDCGDV